MENITHPPRSPRPRSPQRSGTDAGRDNSGPVHDFPLAAADFRTINIVRDFEDTALAPPGCRTGESQMLRYHPEQKWYYTHEMQIDECILLKNVLRQFNQS
jgi:hypothetical protein